MILYFGVFLKIISKNYVNDLFFLECTYNLICFTYRGNHFKSSRESGTTEVLTVVDIARSHRASYLVFIIGGILVK